MSKPIGWTDANVNASRGGNASQVAQKAKRAGRALFDDQFEPSAGGLVLGSV
jgi:hypothetical protein